MPKSKINIVLLEEYFETNSKRAFTFSDLESILLEHAQTSNLPRSMTPQPFVEMLLSTTKLQKLKLQSSDYPALLRYSWGKNASPVSVAVSVKNGAFFSHASAMWIHGLNRDHKNIFVNKEQSEKRPNSDQLSQEAIHRAFRNQQVQIPRHHHHGVEREIHGAAGDRSGQSTLPTILNTVFTRPSSGPMWSVLVESPRKYAPVAS